MESTIEMATNIVASYVSKNPLKPDEVPGFLRQVHASITGIASPPAPVKRPFISPRLAVKPDHLVCLHCGKKLTMLKRHLRADHDQSPAEYRETFALGADYPMTAPNYSKLRSEFAKDNGLGRTTTAEGRRG